MEPDARWVAVPCEGDRLAVFEDAGREGVVEHDLGGPLRALRWSSPDHLLAMVTLRADGPAATSLWSSAAESVEGLDVLPNDRGVRISLRRYGRRVWLALDAARLRSETPAR